MRALVCNDLHLKPAASDYNVDAMAVPDNVDVAFIAGDLTHRDGEADVALAHRFVKRFAPDIPVLYVPGNHDHAPMPERVVDGFQHATDGHETVRKYGSSTVIGWGCERRSLDDALDQTEFPALDPRTAPRGERRYAADRTADAIEAALANVIIGERSVDEAAEDLGIADRNLAAFHHSVDTVQETYDHLATLVGDHLNVVIVAHRSPFNTSFDRHHSTGTREEDREALHTGSIALKLVARSHDVYATISGHSHSFGYNSGDGNRPPHMLNLGYRGLGLVELDPPSGVFSFVDQNAN